MLFTFHRAFDCVPNPKETLEQLIALGVDRILTSGQEDSAIKGLNLLKKIQQKANGRLTILPGSGINPNNAKLFETAGFKELHASASKMVSSEAKPSLFDTDQKVSDVKTIQSILKAMQ